MNIELGTTLKYTNWKGKAYYYKVVDFAWTPVCRFLEGETVMLCDAANHESSPICQQIHKNGKPMKCNPVRVDAYKECEVIRSAN